MNENKKNEVSCEDQNEISNHKKLEKIENAHVREKMEKIRLLSLRLKECETENQILEKNLRCLKQLICREIGSNCLNVQELMKQGTRSAKKERIENVFLLKYEVDELHNYLNQLEDCSGTAKNFPTKEYLNQQILVERKAFWRMELERRLANETAEKEINSILKEKNDTHDKLLLEKKRLCELSDEIHLLRGEIETQMDTKEKSKNIANLYQNIEKQLQKTFLERGEIRQELIDVKARNQRLKYEIFALRDDSKTLDDNIKKNNTLIFSHVEKKKRIRKTLEEEKIFFQKNTEYYKSELDKFKDRYDEDVMILDSVRKRILETRQILAELDRDVGTSNFANLKESEEEENTSLSKIKSSNLNPSLRKLNSKNNNLKERMSANEDVAVSDDVDYSKEKFDMFLDWIKYKCLLETTEYQNELLSFIIQGQQRQISEMEILNNEMKKEIKKKISHKNILLKKLTNCRKLHSKKKANISLKSKNELAELRIKIKVQKEANTFLRSFFKALFESRAKEFVQYKTILINRKEFYLNTLQDIYSITRETNNHQR